MMLRERLIFQNKARPVAGTEPPTHQPRVGNRLVHMERFLRTTTTGANERCGHSVLVVLYMEYSVRHVKQHSYPAQTA